MDRDRYSSPLMSRQGSNAGYESPIHPGSRHARTGSTGVSSVRRSQNNSARAAAQRLAQAMANIDDDDDDNSEELAPFAFPSRLAPSPQVGRSSNDSLQGGLRSSSAGRPSITRPLASAGLMPTPAPAPPSISSNTRPLASPSPMSTPTLAPSSIPSITRPLTSAGTVSMPALTAASITANKLRLPTPSVTTQLPSEVDMPRFGRSSSTSQDDKRETASLYDKIDLLEEEKEDLADQLRSAEDKWKAAEARAKELEKQVASLGEGISLEARLLARKEAVLKQREEALLAAKQSKDVRDDEIAALRLDVEPYGTLHGGISSIVAEALASMGAYAASKSRVAGIQLKINHMKAAPLGMEIFASAKPVHKGRTIHVWDVKLTPVNDLGSDNPDSALIALSRVTIMVGLSAEITNADQELAPYSRL